MNTLLTLLHTLLHTLLRCSTHCLHCCTYCCIHCCTHFLHCCTHCCTHCLHCYTHCCTHCLHCCTHCVHCCTHCCTLKIQCSSDTSSSRKRLRHPIPQDTWDGNVHHVCCTACWDWETPGRRTLTLIRRISNTTSFQEPGAMTSLSLTQWTMCSWWQQTDESCQEPELKSTCV